MSASERLELETLAAKHSTEIHRMLSYLTDDEQRGNLNYLRRIDNEYREAA